MSAILGVLFASLVGLLMIPTYMRFETMAIDNAKAATTAQQMQQVSRAAQAYIQANYSAVEANSTASSPATITVSMLQNTGYLPNAFSAANPFGQMWQVQVLQPTPGQLQALVLTQGGTQIGQVQAPMIAAQAGAQGGFVPYNGQYGTLNDMVAHGAYSGWQVSMSGYTNPGPGHLAALLAFNNGNLENNYLYRVAVPGQPQLNTMQTNLNMGANSVNNANEVNAQSETLAGGQPNGQPGALQIGSNYYYGDSSNAAVRTPGSFYIQNQNGSGPAQIAEVSNVWGSGELQGGYVNSTGDVNAQYNSTANNAFAMDNGSWWANNAGDSSQSGNLWASGNINTPGFYANNNGYAGTSDTLTVGSRVILGTAFGSANIGWGCSPNGEIAANANGSGQVLACQGGSWQAMGGGYTYEGSWQIPYGTATSENIGNYDICAMTQYGTSGNDNSGVYPSSGPYANGTYSWVLYAQGADMITASCWDIG
ncbi:shufflon system plasmid conjugative transfer pilus tip adhesin PilV [Acidithiobacillus ferrivorans]|uniref:Shufflon system plasmid conjugative transfer pilus tip adhesin PilV n=1 Tax=Acidithiobacillus ferrivorans TaxID=160808 RepID=A0A7T4WCD5_9PROT|nr:shufflon system plasmid conjugative transfer pilus tip adhesin PilV [Acidithiobacillus ferrivorans]QQD72001.1 shufflon system plasmid conjugative transfer pilus tip adhesin PilV [Acidithiobacillus ferrivorans]